jgi:hypothetical protein
MIVSREGKYGSYEFTRTVQQIMFDDKRSFPGPWDVISVEDAGT